MARESHTTTTIDRREAIRRVSILLGGIALVSEGALLTACGERTAKPAGAASFSNDDIAFLDEVADTILPDTTTPGAKAAKVGAFMAVMVTDAYSDSDRTVFRDGMGKLEASCQAMYHVSFMAAAPAQRLAVLVQLDHDQKTYMDTREATRNAAAASGAEPPDTPAHYFRMMKELALLGYFTSEIGYTKAMRYQEAPGRFDPCVPYTPGETSWAAHA